MLTPILSSVMLVGNKYDLRHLRAVPTEEAKAYAGSYTIKMEKLNFELNLHGAVP